MIKTMRGLKIANKQRGFFFFDEKMMRIFDSIIETDLSVAGEVGFFVSSEKCRTTNTRLYTIRKALLDSGGIYGKGFEDSFRTLDEAKEEMERQIEQEKEK